MNIRNSINKSQPFKVSFIQQVYYDDELEIEESGEIIYHSINKLKWIYLHPEHKEFIIIDNNYQFYNQEDNELTIGQIEKKNQQWIWQLLFSDEISSHIKEDKKNDRIYIKKEADDIDFEIIIGKDLLPKMAIQKDATGIKYIYSFSNYKKKIKTENDDFILKLPENVDIIDLR